MGKNNKINWTKVLIQITDDKVNKDSVYFGSKEFLFKYIGRESDRMGYLIIWEKQSKRAINFSRLKVPIYHKMISMNDEKEFLSQVPSDLKFESI